MQIQKVNSGQNNPNFSGILAKVDEARHVDVDHIVEMRGGVGGAVLDLVNGKCVEFSTNLPYNQIVEIVALAKQGCFKHPNGVIDKAIPKIVNLIG